MSRAEMGRRRSAALVVWTFQSMRARGLLRTPDGDDVEVALRRYLTDGDPEEFCHDLVIRMGFGQLEVPAPQRGELAEPVARWARAAYGGRS